MGLNCRKGDIAIYVGVDPMCLGRIFKCVEYFEINSIPGWVVDQILIDPSDGLAWPGIQDRALRPIRDQPGDDETLTWAGKPAPVIRKLSEPEFEAACDRWIQGVEA